MATDRSPSRPRFYYGAKADLKPGDLIEPGQSAGGPDRVTGYLDMTGTVDAAAWEAELGPGDGPGRIYEVEPTGPITEGPDATGQKFPGPAASYRTRDPLRVTGEVTDAHGRPRRLYHGTKADLRPGDLIAPGHSANFGEPDRVSNYVYFTGTLDAATWGAELAQGDGPGRIYTVETTGPVMDDPNLTNVRFPGNPTKSYRTREPLRVLGEVMGWQGHSAETIKAMKAGLEQLKQQGAPIDD